MKVINLFAGPGAGKSTTASGLFFHMKIRDMDVELVTEYAKKLVWQKRYNTLKDQLYVSAKQNHRMLILSEQVEWCITDSPLILGVYYANGEFYPDTYPQFVMDVFRSYDNINIWIERTKKYQPKGRNQTEKEALEADEAIKNILYTDNIPFYTVLGNKDAPEAILEIMRGEYEIPD